MKTNWIGVVGGVVLCGLGAGAGLSKPRQVDPNAATCLSNAKQVALGTLMYIQDYDEVMPNTKSTIRFDAQLMPYVKQKSAFNCPETKKPYKPNAFLSGVQLVRIETPAGTELFRDPLPHKDGLSTYAYVDGHCKRSKTPPAAAKITSLKKGNLHHTRGK